MSTQPPPAEEGPDLTSKSDNPPPPPPDKERDNWKTAYTELGQWARHYSTIRATLTTALITISAALLYYGADKQIKSLLVLSIVVCVLAIVLLWVFTRATLKRYDSQLDFAWKLGMLSSRPKAHRTLNDEGFLVGLVFLIVYLIFWCVLFGWPPVTKPQEVILKETERPIPVRLELPTTTMPKLP